jgi:hypothetical protein
LSPTIPFFRRLDLQKQPVRFVARTAVRERILESMRKLVAAVLVALLTSLASVDAIACPDGCTDEAQEHNAGQPASSGAGCMLCQHAVSPAVSIAILSPVEPVQRFHGPPSPDLVVSPSIGIEHPPRSA